ncbi:MAG: hypothetical protein GY941_16440 [Planctomycetes bacterium]|nr:hypothetical protein [Planctomycetota bacterium]
MDVCPSKEEIHKKIENFSEDKFRRPIMMLALDGDHCPMHPEHNPHRCRGKGEWKEIKGFRLYLFDGQNITHLIS